MVKFAVATKPISFLFKKSKSDTFSLWGDSTLTSISLLVRPVSPAFPSVLAVTENDNDNIKDRKLWQYLVSEIQANGSSRTVDDRVLLLLNVA